MIVEKIYDSIYTRPYAEEDELLNDYVDRILHNVTWKLFEDQQNICYMINEKNPPMLKDNFIEVATRYIEHEFGWLREYLLIRLLIEYRLSNLDLGEENEEWLKDMLGEEEYEDFEKIAKEYIYKDYVKMLGQEEADLYFEKIGRLEEYKVES